MESRKAVNRRRPVPVQKRSWAQALSSRRSHQRGIEAWKETRARKTGQVVSMLHEVITEHVADNHMAVLDAAHMGLGYADLQIG
jgi:hypothetical protein